MRTTKTTKLKERFKNMRDNTADYNQIEMRVKKAIEASGITYDNEDTFKRFIIELVNIASDVGSCKAINKLNDMCKGAH